MRWAVEGAPGSHVPVAPLIMLLATPLLASCSADRSADRTLVLSECRLPKLAQAAQCGTLEVPENRAQPDGRKLGIFVAVLPANTLSPKPDPLVILAGGPGQAASTLGPFASLFSDVRRTRDIVLIDQRGTGRSSPLACKSLKPEWRADFESDINPLPKAKACVAELQSAGVDPAQYTTTAWVDDLEAVRKALGYARLNLWGGSYGTRVALEYLRRHPDRVRTLILDGVAPPSMKITLDVWTTRDAALTQIIAACRASKECVAAHPDPAQTLAEIERNLGPTGKKVSVVEPRSGETIQALITYDLVLAVLQPLMYAPELASLVPELLSRAVAGDYAPLLTGALAITNDLSEQMNTALHYSVTCAEDVPRITPEARRAIVTGVRTHVLAERILAVCDIWPRGSMPPDFSDPVKSDVPTLILSGALDPVTPPQYGVEVARTLANSKHVVAAGYGHVVSPHACAPRLIAAFIDEAGFKTLPKSCLDYFATSTRPPFFTSLLEASP